MKNSNFLLFCAVILAGIVKHWKKILLFSGIAIGVVLTTLLIVGLTPTKVDVTVKNFSWERKISIENYREFSESSWSGFPSGSYDTYTKWEYKETIQVLDHYETKYRTVDCNCRTETYNCRDVDQGNGYFATECDERTVCDQCEESYQEAVYRDEAVYATRYYYKIKRWTHDHYMTTNGADQKPYWGVDSLCIKNPKLWKNGHTSEDYTIFVDDGEQIRKDDVSFGFWKTLKPNQEVKAKKARLFNIWYGVIEG